MIASKLAGLVLLATCFQVARAEEKEADDSDFSFSALFIGFREALEACVIISVMLNMLDKTGNTPLKKWVWVGSFSGLLVSCIVGGGMVGAYYAVKDQVMSDDDMYIFEGVFSGIASIFLTFLGIGFLRFADLEEKWGNIMFKREGEVEAEATGCLAKLKQKYGIQSQAISESALLKGRNFGNGLVDEVSSSSDDDDGGVNKTTIIMLTFSAVFREGLETFLFLGAVGSNAKPSGLAIGGLVGIVLGILSGIAVLYIGRVINDIKWFFIMTTTFILFIGAGLAGYSAHEFEELGKPHSYKTHAPIIMRPMWDISECCPDSSGPGAVFRAISGYQDKPTLIECLVYLAYWIFVLTLVMFRYKNGVLFNRKSKNQSRERDSISTEGVKQEKLKDINGTAGIASPTQAGVVYANSYCQPAPSYSHPADYVQPVFQPEIYGSQSGGYPGYFAASPTVFMQPGFQQPTAYLQPGFQQPTAYVQPGFHFGNA